MVKTYLYIPEQLNDKITYAAKIAKKSKAALIREVLEKGIRISGKSKVAPSDAQFLQHLAGLKEKTTLKEIRDGSINHDHYLWGLSKKKIHTKT